MSIHLAPTSAVTSLQDDGPSMAVSRDTKLDLKHVATATPTAQFAHPVQKLQAEQMASEVQMKQFSLANLYGTHFPMRIQLEKQILSQYHRLPGLPSSFVGLETLMGTDETIEFEDYLSDPLEPLEHVSIHEVAETSLFGKPL